MTRLALCRKCRKIFFTNIRGKYGLRCPQRNCRSEDVKPWSVGLINKLGSEILYDILPKPPEPKSRKRSRKPPKSKPPEPEPEPEIQEPEPEYRYCMWVTRGCINPDKKINEDGHCIKNNLKEGCLLLPDEESQ